MKRIAIVGGGIAGLTAAYQIARLAREGAAVEAVLFEFATRFGGIIETVREGGFTVETGPDAWVTAKPHARELAVELGLESELIDSNDGARRTYIFLTTPEHPSGSLVAMPPGFHMMVPADPAALTGSPLFTAAAIASYEAEPSRAAEFLASIPDHDESVADFTRRHFGPEVLQRVASPLLSGVFGGDVRKLSVRAVMPGFVAMEREHGSLITALQRKTLNDQPAPPIFTTLHSGLGTLIDHLVAAIPQNWLHLQTAVTSIARHRMADSHQPRPWTVQCNAGTRFFSECFDEVILATPLDVTHRLLGSVDVGAGFLLPTESSSAVLVAFAYSDQIHMPLPQGFGFLVPPESGNDSAQPPSLLLACTFVDQKFPGRVPAGGRLIRAYFGGAAADRIARCNNDEIAAIARLELARILGTVQREGNPGDPRPAHLGLSTRPPAPPPALTIVRRLPNSIPQYAVGHLDRIAELRARLRSSAPGLTLLGNATDGVGIPDLIHAARTAALNSMSADR